MKCCYCPLCHNPVFALSRPLGKGGYNGCVCSSQEWWQSANFGKKKEIVVAVPQLLTYSIGLYVEGVSFVDDQIVRF